MRAILKNIFITLLISALAVCLALPCLAEEQVGKITVTLEDKDKNPINDFNVNICRIAELNNTGYYPTPDFENSKISISSIINAPDEIAAKSLYDYIKANNIVALSESTKDGKAYFNNLGIGIWLVYGDADSKYSFNPYIIFLPYQSGGKLYYEVNSSPKIEEIPQNKVNLYVIKKWDDKNNAAKKRPDSITVELLNNSTVINSAELSEANGWAHTFTEVEKGGKYSVKEKSVSNYKATYSGDAENGFIITNTYAGEKLPQTGQYWWPIIVIGIAGICFIVLGVYELGVKKNATKQ